MVLVEEGGKLSILDESGEFVEEGRVDLRVIH